ncbi:hypothetical protein MiTe_04299 [Microcystis aeruginosa NIES-2520]|uniref:Uncharacterized protein n=2 Tax=Microcystis aeruginosa TaxID=1126 RepID=A0A5A5RLI4_MICAE|nr:hypothetical protein O53_212 [Microcystis aeruginosa TAIHU98]ODV38330.1 hypothetical protein BFG60_2287 [Microcystis aeruginosa NIES-98]GBE96519.1 hypothetical protein NIES298_07690 [Microcystis aeruginosa NIES-298]GCA77444.1 hypothetical protein MiTe_04299 [Microcystis aeruginosa NIES-2520]GCA87142.1 hypothetical protein MiTa_00467 [Microcystis aeruginosa NIES-4264]
MLKIKPKPNQDFEDFRIIKILNPKSNQDSQSQIIKEIYDRFNCYF